MSLGLVLVVDDTTDDILLLKHAMQKKQIEADIRVISDSRQAIDYLEGNGSYHDRDAYPYPRMIIVDIKMVRGSGFELLHWIKENPVYQVIPAVVLTASDYRLDVKRAYYEGANCYLVKPGTAEELEALVDSLFQFWKLNRLPEI